MDDKEVETRLNHMVAFIEQEANEKVEEINSKTEEECHIIKNQLVEDEKNKINTVFDKKLNEAQLRWKREEHKARGFGSIQIRHGQYGAVYDILEETYLRLKHIPCKKDEYKKIMKNLILEGLYLLMEHHVVLFCRKRDIELVEEILSKVVAKYHHNTKENVVVTIRRDVYLSCATIGGVELRSLNEKIIVNNTLDSRLHRIFKEKMPYVRSMLFQS